VPQTIAELLAHAAPDPSEALSFDRRLASGTPIDEATRYRMWETLESTLGHGPTDNLPSQDTGLLLGRIQSGKTTAMTGLSALAHDEGYRLIIAIMGTTNLLLTQNTSRLLSGLGISEGLVSTYSWVHLDPAVERARLTREITATLDSDRSVLITVLKHSRRIASLAQHLGRIDLRSG
jgi:hypothetical protein